MASEIGPLARRRRMSDQWWSPVVREVVMLRPSRQPARGRVGQIPQLASGAIFVRWKWGNHPTRRTLGGRGSYFADGHPIHKETRHENHSEQITRRHRPSGTAGLDRAQPWVATLANADPKHGTIPLACDWLGSREVVVASNNTSATPGLAVVSASDHRLGLLAARPHGTRLRPLLTIATWSDAMWRNKSRARQEVMTSVTYGSVPLACQ